MKKSNYQAAICLFAGFVGAELAYAAMFKIYIGREERL
jgi:hypothetical protein